jgi:predicted pyridoxine 5'-phosphate oxidase superfamily flavin-nucleotide-binding protein
MGKQLDSLNDKLTEFIGHQKMFFIGTAGREGKINLSPKGMDTFRILTTTGPFG